MTTTDAGQYVSGIDHVAITFLDLEAATAYYDRLFGLKVTAELMVEGRLRVRQALIGGAMFSMHQAENGIDLVARRPTPGSVDLCLRWTATIEEAVALLARNGIESVGAPVDRKYSNGEPSTSVYFLDLDGNLIELMAPRRT